MRYTSIKGKVKKKMGSFEQCTQQSSYKNTEECYHMIIPECEALKREVIPFHTMLSSLGSNHKICDSKHFQKSKFLPIKIVNLSIYIKLAI